MIKLLYNLLDSPYISYLQGMTFLVQRCSTCMSQHLVPSLVACLHHALSACDAIISLSDQFDSECRTVRRAERLGKRAGLNKDHMNGFCSSEKALLSGQGEELLGESHCSSLNLGQLHTSGTKCQRFWVIQSSIRIYRLLFIVYFL